MAVTDVVATRHRTEPGVSAGPFAFSLAWSGCPMGIHAAKRAWARAFSASPVRRNTTQRSGIGWPL